MVGNCRSLLLAGRNVVGWCVFGGYGSVIGYYRAGGMGCVGICWLLRFIGSIDGLSTIRRARLT